MEVSNDLKRMKSIPIQYLLRLIVANDNEQDSNDVLNETLNTLRDFLTRHPKATSPDSTLTKPEKEVAKHILDFISNNKELFYQLVLSENIRELLDHIDLIELSTLERLVLIMHAWNFIYGPEPENLSEQELEFAISKKARLVYNYLTILPYAPSYQPKSASAGSFAYKVIHDSHVQVTREKLKQKIQKSEELLEKNKS